MSNMTAKETLVQVTSAYFCAGIVINPETKKCIAAAPILNWAIGKDAAFLRTYFQTKRWKAVIVTKRINNL